MGKTQNANFKCYFEACPCSENCPFGCIGCNNDICFQKYGALFVLNMDTFNTTKNAFLFDMNADEINGLDFKLGFGSITIQHF